MTASIAAFLDDTTQIDAADQTTFNGFNGVHGGLAVALLVRRMRALVPAERRLAAVTARFVRPLAWPIEVDATVLRNGSALTVTRASAGSGSGTSVEATAVFGTTTRQDIPLVTPAMPTGIVGRADATTFEFPTAFVPIAARMEIKPASGGLPYSGSSEPAFCAWLRLRDGVPVDDERITILVDSLAPSYTAVLREFKAVPTIEMSLQLSAAATEDDGEADWVLIRARTDTADAHGFVRETIDLWTESGRYIAGCTQLRIVR